MVTQKHKINQSWILSHLLRKSFKRFLQSEWQEQDRCVGPRRCRSPGTHSESLRYLHTKRSHTLGRRCDTGCSPTGPLNNWTEWLQQSRETLEYVPATLRHQRVSHLPLRVKTVSSPYRSSALSMWKLFFLLTLIVAAYSSIMAEYAYWNESRS